MDLQLKENFIELWGKYFGSAELPIVFSYNDNLPDSELIKKPEGHTCVIQILNKARKGKSITFSSESFGCFGGKKYMGFTKDTMPNFEYFLSCGIPDKMEGERYKKSPEIVKEVMKNWQDFTAPGKYITFKRWDMLEGNDNPEVVIFYATPDVLSGLFTLAGFDQTEPASVYAPFAAGCGSIVMYPYQEMKRDNPRSVIGMFDVSARPYVPEGTLTFSIPMNRLETIINYMEESFLITDSWSKVKKRIDS